MNRHDPIKVHSFHILGDGIQSKRLRRRWYRLTDSVTIVLVTNYGIIRVRVRAGFCCDGRSGGVAVDWLFPNWGNQDERACVLVHDALFYDLGLSFETSNEILRQMIILTKYPEWRANLVHWGVSGSIGRKAFGMNNPQDEELRKYLDLDWDDV